jgi:phage gp36-like protein
MPLSIAPDDFITFYGTQESTELTNIENPAEKGVNYERLEMAMTVAKEFIMGYDSLCSHSGMVAIRKAFRRLLFDITRYFLDSLHRREDVTKNYEDCVRFLEKCLEMKGSTSLTAEEAEELEMTANASLVKYSSGRRAFTDENLTDYRKGKLFFR